MSLGAIPSKFDGQELERKLFRVYTDEINGCDEVGQSTQHIGDEWMRREIRKICGFDVSDKWIKQFRRKFNIRYFSGRRHTNDVLFLEKKTKKEEHVRTNVKTGESVVRVQKMPSATFVKERRVLRQSRKEYEDVDTKVNDEIVRRQQKSERLTNPWIREYAQSMAAQLYPADSRVIDFFDNNWLFRFKRRYNIELKPRSPSVVCELPQIPPQLHREEPISIEQMINNSPIFSALPTVTPNIILPTNFSSAFCAYLKWCDDMYILRTFQNFQTLLDLNYQPQYNETMRNN